LFRVQCVDALLNFRTTFSRFDTIPELDIRTDRQTDEQIVTADTVLISIPSHDTVECFRSLFRIARWQHVLVPRVFELRA